MLIAPVSNPLERRKVSRTTSCAASSNPVVYLVVGLVMMVMMTMIVTRVMI